MSSNLDCVKSSKYLYFSINFRSIVPSHTPHFKVPFMFSGTVTGAQQSALSVRKIKSTIDAFFYKICKI